MQPKICVKFGKHLQEIRRAKGISLNILALENDLNKSTLSRIENGLVDPKLSTLHKIAESLGITLSELLNFK